MLLGGEYVTSAMKISSIKTALSKSNHLFLANYAFYFTNY